MIIIVQPINYDYVTIEILKSIGLLPEFWSENHLFIFSKRKYIHNLWYFSLTTL